MELHISPSDFELIISHARRDAPDEACGLLGGLLEGGVAAVHHIVAIPNVAVDARQRFDMQRPALVRAIFSFRRARLEVVGVYHSHPMGSAEPSASDIAEASWPDAVYLIVGGAAAATPDVRAWTIRAAQVRPVRIVLTPP